MLSSLRRGALTFTRVHTSKIKVTHENMLWSISLVLNTSKHTNDNKKSVVDVRKNEKEIHCALSKNLNCEKTDLSTHLFYFVFLLPIFAIKTYKTYRVGHHTNCWANRLFVAQKTLILLRYLCRPWTCLSQTIYSFSGLVPKSNIFK